MALDLSAYYLRFDRDKSYKRHLFRDSKGFQSAEGNEIHDFPHDNFSLFTKALVGDGAILQGSIAYINQAITEVSLEEGSIITEGYVIQFNAQTLSIDNVSTFTIGVAILSEIVTEIEDAGLKDPATGTVNFNQPGAHRLKITGRWAFSNDYDSSTERFYPIHSIIEGKLVSKQPWETGTIANSFVELVARYDRGSHGNYVVEGMDVVYVSEDVTNQKHNISVISGLAHVFGYEIKFARDRQVKIDWAMDEKSVNNEPHTFTGDGWYTLWNNPISQLGEIDGTKEVTQNITHGGYIGCKDELPFNPVEAIISVSYDGTTYTEGADYLKSGNDIDWSPAGLEPPTGASYEVIWEYNDVITCPISADLLSIEITGFKVGTVFSCDYQYYAPRYDKINLLRNGKIFVTKGIPADEDDIKKPINNEGLPLATLKIYYGREPVIEYDGYRAYKMSDIANMQDQISDLRYNLARISQMEDVALKDPTTNKKNMFVDPFFDDDLRDAGLENKAIIMDGILNPNVVWSSNLIRSGFPILLANTSKNVINQTAYTKTRKINEFDYAETKTVITCVPASMRWISSVTGSGRSPEQVEDENASIPSGTMLQVTGNKYAAWENVIIYVDDVEAKVTSADVVGAIDVTFEVPNGIKAGTKQISALGEISKALGTTAFVASAIQQRTAIVTQITQATETQIASTSFDRNYGELPIDLQEKVRDNLEAGYTAEYLEEHYAGCMSMGRTLADCVRNDPLAQTFLLESSGFIKSCWVYFTKIPVDSNEIVEVAIHNTQVGIPDRDGMVVHLEKFAGDLIENAWNEFEFDYPVFLAGEVEYAMVVFSRDTETFIRVAELGGYDLQNNTWVSSQVHSGVLLQSANRSTWTAIQTEDMTFKMDYADFSLIEEVLLGTLNLIDVTDINLTATAIILANTNVVFRVELTDRSEIVTLNPGKTSKVVQYTGEAKFYAVLSTTDSTLSPSIDGDITITTGLVEFPVNYISRQFSIDGDYLNVYLDVFEPTNATVKVYYQDYTSAIGILGGEITITAVQLLGEDGNFLVELIHDPAIVDPGDTIAYWYDTPVPGKITVHINDGVSTQANIANALRAVSLQDKILAVDLISGHENNVWTLTGPAMDEIQLSGGDRWKSMIKGTATPIGNGWVDTLYNIGSANVTSLSDMRIRIELDTTNNYNRSYAENLRSYVY